MSEENTDAEEDVTGDTPQQPAAMLQRPLARIARHWSTIWRFVTRDRNSRGIQTIAALLVIVGFGLSWLFFATDLLNRPDHENPEHGFIYVQPTVKDLTAKEATDALREYIDATKGDPQEIGQSKSVQGLLAVRNGKLIGEDLSEITFRRLDFEGARLTRVDLSKGFYFLSDFRDSKILNGKLDNTAFILSDLSNSDLELTAGATVFVSGSRLDNARIVAHEDAKLYLSGTTFEGAQFNLNPRSQIVIDRSDGTGAWDHEKYNLPARSEVMENVAMSALASQPDKRGDAEQALAIETKFRHVELMPSSCVNLELDDCQVDLSFNLPPTSFVEELSAQGTFDENFRRMSEEPPTKRHWSTVRGSVEPSTDVEFKIPRIVLGDEFDEIWKHQKSELDSFNAFEESIRVPGDIHNLLKKTAADNEDQSPPTLLDYLIDRASQGDENDFATAETRAASGLDVSQYVAMAKLARQPKSDMQSRIALASASGLVASQEVRSQLASLENSQYLLFSRASGAWTLTGTGSAPSNEEIILPTNDVGRQNLLIAEIDNLATIEDQIAITLAGTTTEIDGWEPLKSAESIVFYVPVNGMLGNDPTINIESASCDVTASDEREFCRAMGSGGKLSLSFNDIISSQTFGIERTELNGIDPESCEIATSPERIAQQYQILQSFPIVGRPDAAISSHRSTIENCLIRYFRFGPLTDEFAENMPFAWQQVADLLDVEFRLVAPPIYWESFPTENEPWLFLAIPPRSVGNDSGFVRFSGDIQLRSELGEVILKISDRVRPQEHSGVGILRRIGERNYILNLRGPLSAPLRSNYEELGIAPPQTPPQLSIIAEIPLEFVGLYIDGQPVGPY